MIFAAITLAELTPILAIFVGMLGGFYAIAKFMLSQAVKDREADRSERINLANVIGQLAEAKDREAQATEDGFNKLTASSDQAAAEAKERNGHLGELIVQQGVLTKAIIDRAVSKITEKVQHIEKQEVDIQHINKVDKE